MSTSVEDQRHVRTRENKRTVITSDETKASFKTTEIVAFVATVVGVLVAASMDSGIDARLAWILVSALSIGYMLSRGFAKSGSRHHEDADTI